MSLHFGTDCKGNEYWKVDQVEELDLLVKQYLGWSSLVSFLSDCELSGESQKFQSVWFMTDGIDSWYPEVVFADASEVTEGCLPNPYFRF